MNRRNPNTDATHGEGAATGIHPETLRPVDPAEQARPVRTAPTGPAEVIRCAWAERSPEERAYHDQEWGTPVHDDRLLFEFLVLEGAQAGLSWLTVLRKRAAYRAAFAGFDPERVAGYDEAEVSRMLRNPGLIRNRLKLESAITNARAFLAVQAAFGRFDDYLWQFVDGTPVQNAWRTAAELPARTPISDRLSRDLGQRGFRFVGSIICYAWMQAVGLVNDHTRDCFRHAECHNPR